MIDFEAIRLSLQEWVVRSTVLTDEKVVFNDQADPQPDKPYIAMKMSFPIDIGLDDARLSVDDSGNADFLGNREFTLSIQLYGLDAMTTLSILRDSLNGPDELQLLRDKGLVFVDQLLFDDITELLETIWEERGVLDLLFRTTSVSNHHVGIIEGVYLNTNWSAQGGDTISNNVPIQDPDAIAGQILKVDDAIISIVAEQPTIVIT